MQALAGEIADGCLTPSITTPAFVRYTRENVAADIDIGCTVVASIHESDRDAGRDGAREIAGMYLANKLQNIQGSADTLLDLAGIEHGRDPPVAEAMEQGGRLAAKAQVTDVAPRQLQADRWHARRLHRGDRGVPRGRLHARHARALGRPATRPDPALRREGAPTLPVMSDFDAFDAFEEAGWSTKEAAAYDSLLGRVTSRLADALLDAVGAGPGKRLLDVATGPGYVAASAAGRGADSWASTSPRRCSTTHDRVLRASSS